MHISQLINTLQAILNDYGDIQANIYYDELHDSDSTRKSPTGASIDDINTIRISDDCNYVMLSNEYSFIDEYCGCKCEVYFNPATKVYEGKIIPAEYIEGFNTSFTCYNKYEIEDTFHIAVDEYLDFLGNAKITKTYEAVENIGLNPNDQDLDYGEVESVYPESEDDDLYGE